jgi:hypothetical protein
MTGSLSTRIEHMSKMREANGVKSKIHGLTGSVVMINLGYVRIVRVHLVKPVATEVRCLTF